MKQSIATMCLLTTLISFAAHAAPIKEDPTCVQPVRRLAKALNFAANGSNAMSENIDYQGADESFHYIVSVSSNPITWGDGHRGPLVFTYVVTLDNDSPEVCSVESIQLK